jgi:hypothetical protein
LWALARPISLVAAGRNPPPDIEGIETNRAFAFVGTYTSQPTARHRGHRNTRSVMLTSSPGRRNPPPDTEGMEAPHIPSHGDIMG